MKVLTTGLCAEYNFGCPSILHGMEVLLHALHGDDVVMVNYQTTVPDPVSVEDMGFVTKTNNTDYNTQYHTKQAQACANYLHCQTHTCAKYKCGNDAKRVCENGCRKFCFVIQLFQGNDFGTFFRCIVLCDRFCNNFVCVHIKNLLFEFYSNILLFKKEGRNNTNIDLC